MTDHAEMIRRGTQARAILDDPVFQDAFAQVERRILELWRSSDPAATIDRERMWLALGLLDQLRAVLTITMQTGSVAEAEIQALLRPVPAIA